MKIQLLDRHGHMRGSCEGVIDGHRFLGNVRCDDMPQEWIDVFLCYEEYANSQVLSLIDSMDERVGNLGIRLRFEDGVMILARDLQVFPTERTMSCDVSEYVD